MDQVPASSANEILTSQSSESPVPFVPRPSVDTEIHESDPTEETRRRYEETRRRYPFRRPKNSEEFVEELIMRKLMKKKVAKEEKKDEPKKEDGKKTEEKRKPEVKKEAPKTGDQEKNKPMPKIEEQKGERTKAEDYGKYETLRRAAVDEDWDFVKKFIEDNPEALTAELLDSSETILHYVVKSENMIDFGRELVAKMPEEALELTDIMDMTALSYCAAYGNTEAAKIMVQKNHKLINIPDRWGRLPLHYAARFGHKDTVDFLFSVISKHDPSPFKGESGVRLVQQLITANLYG